MDGLVRRHRHKRKQEEREKEVSPAAPRGFWVAAVDRMTLVAGIIGPLMTIPQIIEIYYWHHAAGVSWVSWLAFGILDVPFLLYGFIHKDRPIITTYILWFTANIVVAVGAIIYK